MAFQPLYMGDWNYGTREHVNDYRPGGLHPTHLDNLLGENDRYRIVQKLGQGSFGTVWLCRDAVENEWKAVKILRAEDSTEDCADFEVCQVSEKMDPETKHPTNSHIAFPIDHFWLDGPNGRHLCVVMPLLGPNIVGVARRYEYREAPLKEICRQIVSAMECLHKNGICHGDFRPHNICRTVEGLENASEQDIFAAYGRPKLWCIVGGDDYDWEENPDASFEGDGEDVADQTSLSDEDHASSCERESAINSGLQTADERHLDAAQSETILHSDIPMDDCVPGMDDARESDQEIVDYKGTEYCPRYLVTTAYFDHASKYISDNIAVIDFGESFLHPQPRYVTGIPHAYRSPEGFLDHCGDLRVGRDIWALGCTLHEVRHGECPFGNGPFWSLVSHWEELSGPMPDPFRSSLADEDEYEVPEDPQRWVSMEDEADMEIWIRQWKVPDGTFSALRKAYPERWNGRFPWRRR